MMAEVDADHNGKVELEEFIILMFKNDMSTSDDNKEDMKIAFKYDIFLFFNIQPILKHNLELPFNIEFAI